MPQSLHRLSFVAALALLTSAPLLAQDDLGWANDPNDEPGTNSTLFDRTDSGNVAQAARMAYAAGERELRSAAKMEGKLPGLEGKKLESTQGKIVKAYERAAENFQDAIRTNPKMIEAYSGLSKAFRASGKHAEALQVSAQGLKLAPENDDVFAGWAASLLDMNMLGDATQAYTALQPANPERAAVLMTEMKEWLRERLVDPGELDPEAVSRMSQWISEQESPAGGG